MARTLINAAEDVASGSVTRGLLNTSTAGSAVLAKIIAGANITISSTGADAGTGDVTINASSTVSSSRSIRTITAGGPVTATSSDDVILIKQTVGAAITVNLNTSPAAGQHLTVKDGKGDAASNNITITPAAGTIDGAASFVMASGYEAIDLTYNGTEWSVV